ncbi:MAG: hypothetical protein P8Y44_14505 [Acidobacteriota bacterium]
MDICRATFLLLLLAIGDPVLSRAAEFGFADTLLAKEYSSAPIQEDEQGSLDDGRRNLHQFPRNLGLGFTGVFTRQNLKPFLIGASVTAAGVVFDDMFRSALGDEGSNSADIANDYGGPLALGALTTGLFVAGRYSEDQKFRATTYDMAIAALVNLTYTGALKALVERDRPNESVSDTFPSGHATNAFALASVAAQHYKGKLRTISSGRPWCCLDQQPARQS